MVDIVQQVSTDIVLSDKSEAEAGTNNTKFMTPLRTKEAIDKNLVPFNAMSQSQFEAIREQNKEKYAASAWVHKGKHVSDGYWKEVNQGIWVSGTESSKTIRLGAKISNAIGFSKTELSTLHIAGVIFSDLLFNEGVGQPWSNVKFPEAPDGKTTYNKSTGAIVTHVDSTTAFAAQQADPTNVEVVINRPDMWGFEAWLEEVNSTNPHIYPNGLPQSQAATMDGITTSASARPVTYYAVFDGDTGSKGKGVNFFTLTDAQKKKVLGNHKNNLYYLDDGRLVQWRLRQRTIAGAGNGDWLAIDSAKRVGYLQPSNLALVQPQGGKSSIASLGNSWPAYVNRTTSVTHPVASVDSGIYGANASPTGQDTLAGVNGECYFLVCGTVNRLNSGFYHPSLNANGSAKAIGDTFWYNTAQSFTTTADCFNPAKLLAGSGSIASGKSGRPAGENQYFDAIYASGFGGVCRDMRYSAYGLTPTDFAEADQRVKNGSYRGFEKAVFSQFKKADYATSSIADGKRINRYNAKLLDWIPTNTYEPVTGWMVDGAGSIRPIEGIGYFTASSQTFVKLADNDVATNNTAAHHIVVTRSLASSIGGSFLQTDVIGSPSNILATPQLANGWQGSWITVIPDNQWKGFPRTRKAISLNNFSMKTADAGESWSVITQLPPAADNIGLDMILYAADVAVIQYQAFAKQTKPSANAVVYGGQSGIGVVQQSSDYRTHARGALMESLLGLIPKNNTNVTYGDKALTQVTIIVANGLLPVTDGYTVEHQAISLGIPVNSSPAFKALNYNVATNQQGFINYAYTELKHNGTNWGDDSKVTIVDNQSTKTDLNGNTVLVGTAQLVEPLGWIKNKV